ncbi:MAG: group II intron reverse transcriptase/maturase [Bacteroidota bacterium]
MSAINWARVDEGSHHGSDQLMEQVVHPTNMGRAYRQVVGNKGSAGVDGMTVSELLDHLRRNWESCKSALLSGSYYPQVVRAVEIPKPHGGVRKLGIPTVMDRLIQQALYQVLNPLYDPTFTDRSYGFRPGRNAQQAVRQSRAYIRAGKRWVVDLDLSKFFDEVHHDRLLSKLRHRIKDRRVIHLIDRYLRSGMMLNGVEQARIKGTPQGSPLSPLLSNIVLDELDKELESRGLSYVRYADDFQIYVRTKRSAERVKASTKRFIAQRLRLKVNEEKSAIGRSWERDFLGYSFTVDKQTKLKPSKQSIKGLRQKIKQQLRRGKGRNLFRFIREDLNPILRGWINYFNQSQTKGFAKQLDSWISRHLRKIKWRQLKRPWSRMQELIRQGLSEQQAAQSAFNQRGPWWNAGAAHMNLAFPGIYFAKLGLVNLSHVLSRSSR